MKYAADLSLPFEVDLRSLAIRDCDPKKLGHFHLDPAAVPMELLQFLAGLGVSITHGEIFHTPAYARLPIHVDGDKLCNIVKLNWCYGANGSRMNWFQLKDPSAPLPMKQTIINTNYIQPTAEQCRMVHSAKIGLPTLVNVGVPHSVINPTPERRWVVSLVLAADGVPLEWDRAMQIFQRFIK